MCNLVTELLICSKVPPGHSELCHDLDGGKNEDRTSNTIHRR